MKYIFINPNELDGHKISYDYVTQKKKIQEILKDYKIIKLISIVKDINSGLKIKKKYYSEKGCRIIAPGDIQNGIINLYELKCVKKDVVKEKDIIASGDILVTATGRSGQIVYANDEFDGCAITSDIIRIRAADKEKTLFLLRLLKSEVGQMMLNTIKIGLVNKILVEDMEELILPQNYILDEINYNDISGFQMKVSELYKEAYNIFSMFLEYNGESKLKKHFFTYEHLDNNRLDPIFYTNFYSELYKTINMDTKKIKWQCLGEVVQIKVAVKPLINNNKKVQYFTLSDVDEKLSIIKEIHEDEFGKLSNRMRNVVKEGEIVTAKGGSATGTKTHASALITKKFDGMITTDAFFNIMPINIDRYYLLFVLKQLFVINQINVITKGTVYKLISKEDFLKIKIPRLDKKSEMLISSRIRLIFEQ